MPRAINRDGTYDSHHFTRSDDLRSIQTASR